MGIEWETPILQLCILRRGTFEVPRVSLPSLYYSKVLTPRPTSFHPSHTLTSSPHQTKTKKTFGGRSSLANRDMQCVVQGLG